MTSLKCITFLKAPDGKHYLDNQSGCSGKGYLRKEKQYVTFNFYLTKVNEKMHIKVLVENLILGKTAWANLSKLFRVCFRDIYHAKKYKKNYLFNLFQVKPFFHLD